MKAAKLIEALTEFDPDCEVLVLQVYTVWNYDDDTKVFNAVTLTERTKYIDVEQQPSGEIYLGTDTNEYED